MSLVLLGLNHKTAPVEIREKFSFSEQALEYALENLVDGSIIKEGIILSTCNRTEIYAWSPQNDEIIEKLKNFFVTIGGISLPSILEYLYSYTNEDVVRHLFEVTCGLDSMIVGEGQILGQVKKSFSIARNLGYTGAILNKFFDNAVRAGKRARAETAICRGASSVSFAAMELAKMILGELTHCKILLIGAGKMSELTVKLLVSSGVRFVMVANRTLEKAKEIAELYSGQVIPFDELPVYLTIADAVITSTAAPDFVLTKDTLAASMKVRKGRPLLIVDIAVPRDVEPQAGQIENVYLYNIDDLQTAVDQNLVERSKEIEKVKKIICEEMSQFDSFLRLREVVPVIKRIREYFEEIGKSELERVTSKDPLTEREKHLLESFCASLLQKLLHRPTVKLKEMADRTIDDKTIEMIEKLFLSSDNDEGT